MFGSITRLAENLMAFAGSAENFFLLAKIFNAE